jgi:hypothetical protein
MRQGLKTEKIIKGESCKGKGRLRGRVIKGKGYKGKGV